MTELVYIALGSNLLDPESQVLRAIEKLRSLPDFEVLAASSCYQSRPMGPKDQPDYINAVVKAETKHDASGLLDQLQSIEADSGRIRNGQRWGPRVLDLDILLYGNHIIQTDRLIVPHAGIAERAFVLIPLLEINEQLVIPGLGNIKQLIARLRANDINTLEKL